MTSNDVVQHDRATSAGPTAHLAEWAAALSFDALPEQVVDNAKLRLLDFVASAVVGAGRDHSRSATEVVAQHGAEDGPCTIVGRTRRTGPQWASLLNGTYGSSAPNLDDYWTKSYGHPGVGAFPAALAAAEVAGASGADLLLASVVGYEFAMRIGAAVGISAFHNNFHPRGGCNAIAAATAFLKASGSSDPAEYRRAIGHAGNMTGGTVSGSYYFDTFNFLSGVASMNGALAAEFAARGITSHEAFLDPDAPGNYIDTISPSPDFAELTTGLGEDFQILEACQKVFPATGSLHPMIEAALAIVGRRGVELASTESVLVETFRLAAGELNTKFPEHRVHATLSAPFLVCLALLRGDVTMPLVEAGLGEEDVRRLQEVTEVRVDPAIDARTPAELASRVTVTFRDGTTDSEERGQHLGMVSNPMSYEQTVTKLERMTTGVISDAQRRQIVAAVDALERADDLGELGSALSYAQG